MQSMIDDVYCFVVIEKDETLSLFLKEKIDEAFENIERPKTS